MIKCKELKNVKEHRWKEKKTYSCRETAKRWKWERDMDFLAEFQDNEWKIENQRRMERLWVVIDYDLYGRIEQEKDKREVLLQNVHSLFYFHI